MPAYLAAVLTEVSALEAQCADLDRSIAAADWDSSNAVLQQMRRTTHALENAMSVDGVADTPGFNDHVMSRLARVHAYREHQLRQLEAVRDGIGDQLRSISRFKGYARAIGAKNAPNQARALDSLR